MGKRATLLTLAALLLMLSGITPPAQAFVLQQPPTLSDVCKMAQQIAVLRIEKVNREKNGIVYRKVRDLKGTFPGGFKEYEGAHILRKTPAMESHPGDAANHDQLNDAILALAAEGIQGRRVYGSPTLHRGRIYLSTCNFDQATPIQNLVVCIGDK